MVTKGFIKKQHKYKLCLQRLTFRSLQKMTLSVEIDTTCVKQNSEFNTIHLNTFSIMFLSLVDGRSPVFLVAVSRLFFSVLY